MGPLNARLLVVGLAPGLRGANRTGVPFTGDASGDWLFEALAAFAFTRSGAPSAADLHDAAITNAVRCAPPKNRPTGAETAACRPHLVARIGSMRSLRAIVALGRVAHETVLTAFGVRRAANPFAHGARHVLIDPHRQRRLDLFDSYHCSRYNVQTGRLSRVAFHSVFAAVRARLDGAEAADE
ncbi:MAG: uracil-DNA glycosylase family protein [Pseudomonadota bacterium]